MWDRIRGVVERLLKAVARIIHGSVDTAREVVCKILGCQKVVDPGTIVISFGQPKRKIEEE